MTLLVTSLSRALAALRATGRIISALALAGIVAAYGFEVVARYVFDSPTWWSAQLVSALLCVLVFAMTPHVTATGGQVAVTVLSDRLGLRSRHVLGLAIAVAGALTCAAIAWFAFSETSRQISRGVLTMAAHPFPKWWISIWIVIGFALTALEFLRLALGGAPAPNTLDTEI